MRTCLNTTKQSRKDATDRHKRMVTPRSEFRKLPCWPSGARWTFSDNPGPIEIDIKHHGGYTVACRIIPATIRFDPTSLWD
ncbi:hypothetical protein DPMN_136442 [Dreissena polymorpha]|uniref:Uncharacterized protein n=1 Tax=Dreissena polymorpha TaxID=45954 RepID=A0A9D4G0W0_DREPO|nr:hypothetical protein DPMN_136442 [Dreissena polymorpha]